jgi:signal peptidase II
VVVLDQWSKFFSAADLVNSKAAFSIPVPNIIVAILAIGVIAGLTFAVSAQNSFRAHWLPLGLLIGGGTSNLTDRILHGAVADIWSYGSLSFNGADVAICLAIVLLSYKFIKLSNEAT